MKKILCAAAALMAVLMLASCTVGKADTETKQSEPTEADTFLSAWGLSEKDVAPEEEYTASLGENTVIFKSNYYDVCENYPAWKLKVYDAFLSVSDDGKAYTASGEMTQIEDPEGYNAWKTVRGGETYTVLISAVSDTYSISIEKQ